MSELIHATTNRGKPYRHLLCSASILTLLALAPRVQAGEADAPTVWIELGGQLARVDGISAPFIAPFADKAAGSPIFEPVSFLDAQRMPRFSYEGEGGLTLAPRDSGWVFSLGARYGRSNGGRDFQQQTAGQMVGIYGPYPDRASYVRTFFGAQYNSTESHTVLDFQAGRDVGLGMSDVSSILGAGVRFAQFTSKAALGIHARPDLQYHKTYPFPVLAPQKYFSRPLFH